MSEPHTNGSSETVIVIEPPGPKEMLWLNTASYRLTARERAVVDLVMKSFSTAQISAMLYISKYTVQEHLCSAFDKVGCGIDKPSSNVSSSTTSIRRCWVSSNEPSESLLRTYLRAETRLAAEVTTFFLCSGIMYQPSWERSICQRWRRSLQMSAVDDVDELIEQFHLAQGEFVKNPEPVKAPLVEMT